MIRALIVDDEPLPRERIRTLLADHEEVVLIGECRDGAEALRAIREKQPDLVFLDIQMPALDGFGVLRALPEDALPVVIFVTAYDAYALEAFAVNAVDYLLKPIHPERFAKALARAVEQLGQHRKQAITHQLYAFVHRLQAEHGYARRFAVRTASKLSFVRVDDIDWIDAAGNYAQLHAGGTVHLVRETMKILETQLNPDVFVRVHRSIIINIDRVASIEPYSHGEYIVTMKDGRAATSRG
jgi:two-component system LytT family response regulator